MPQAVSQAPAVSLEDSFLKFYLSALDKFQNTWLGDSGFESDKFNRQLFFLISLLPDENKQNQLIQKWAESQESYKEYPGLSKEEAIFLTGQRVTTSIIQFLVQSLELATQDITGPATSDLIEVPELVTEKQFRRADVTLPEISPEEIQGVKGHAEN